MGWSGSEPSSYPSGSSWTIATDPKALDGNPFSLAWRVRIRRLNTNQVVVEVRATIYRGSTGNLYPPTYLYARIGSSDYSLYAPPSSHGSHAYRYWTGTCNYGSSLTVYVGYADSKKTAKALRSTTVTGPAYVTQYTISYDANGGINPPSSQPKTYGQTLTLRSGTPSATGFNFAGWATSSSATTAQYQPGGSFTTNANTTLYAVWNKKTYTVSFNGNDADSGTTASQTKTYGETLSLASNGFVKANHSFVHWNEAADDSGTYYDEGGAYNTNSGITLYAIWKKNNIPVYVHEDGKIEQVEKIYVNIEGHIYEATAYVYEGGKIYELT